MLGKLKNCNFTRYGSLVAVLLGVSAGVGGCSHSGKNSAVKSPSKDQTASAEPDKVLYDRAMDDMKHGRYLEGRLTLQTLMNTYGDSEYLAKAKLAMGDSYYKEGGASNLTLAVNQYQEFQTFFPMLEEAAYAQMQIGMAHYRMMEKSDRDSTQVQAAEDAFQTFLLKYPQSPLAPQAEQRLREVQEVLADGEFKVARFYYIKGRTGDPYGYQAATARLDEITERYPLYSQSDEALWMLGNIYSVAKQAAKNEDDKNHWADLAGECYAQIVKDYPLSAITPEAKARLLAMGMAVPVPDPEAVARMKKQQLYERNHRQSVIKLPLELFKTGPGVSTAAQSGDPNLNPPTDAISPTEVLKPGAAGPTFGMNAKPSEPANADSTPTGSVDSVTPVTEVGSTPAGSSAGVEIITPPATDPAGSGTTPATSGNAPATSSSTTTPSTTTAPASTAPATTVPATATPATAPTGGAPGTAAATGTSTTQTSGTQPDGSSATSAQSAAEPSKADKKTESTSKKKKGVKKLIPW